MSTTNTTKAEENAQPHIPSASDSEAMKSRLKESYDAIAATYNDWTTQHSSLREKYLDKLLGYLVPSVAAPSQPGHGQVYRILELGCGAGIPVTERLVNFDFASSDEKGASSFHIVANDLSSTQVELGQKRLGGSLVSFQTNNLIEWIQGDMTKLSFPDESLDAVIGMYSIIHLPKEEQAVMIRRIARWLKRPSSSDDHGSVGGGGIMLLNFGDEASDGEVIDKWLGEDKGWMYWSAWGTEKTMEIVREKQNGLEVLVEEVVSEKEDGAVDVMFLWVIARRT
ncbi:methyltransferase [Rhypophila decipiens]|uniref:Methyltransferase n=1 Tax=Rhypophila decipiens TaxID=261697 RepID=A0AAN6XX97_9PEZI|nr:methyltransferase [Rhypophila decipiens]